jgi:membrane protein DedA with SNARE-associated domain
MTLPDQSPKPNTSYRLIITILAVAISLLILLLKDQIEAFHHFGYLGILVISFAGNATILLPAPVLLTVAALGSTLPPIFVGIVASLGAVLGESVAYFLGLGGNIIVSKSARYRRVSDYLNRRGYWAIFILAALPNPLFDIAGLLAGTLGISYRHFFYAAWAGLFIKYTLVSLLGYGVLFGL